eukprot:Clim_evm7s218 gene=Clim_evmTU7s218
MEDVPSNINFAKAEQDTLKVWRENKVFETSVELSKGRPEFSFYDGPPFATGLPHYGHLLAGTIKDIVTRYAHQTGHYVERRFGWDTHGLPIEYEIDKKLKINGPEDVRKMGIDKYNAECRAIVMRYSAEWERTVERLGRWINFKNDYKTLYPWFMESVWWVFSQMFEKGLVYRGFKVMPYSTGCVTPLSNFEANQNYKDVVDPSCVVAFPLVDEPDVSMLAWTTTPWTLPSNMGLCVNPDFEYVQIKDGESGKQYILLESCLGAIYKNPKKAKFEIVKKMKGIDLKDKRYVPLFPFFEEEMKETAFRVVCGSYVTGGDGTGVVHQAPAFGEDDYNVALENGIITKGGKLPNPVDEVGKFTEEVPDFAGMYVKDADKHIIKAVREKGRLVNDKEYKHSYPFCWRSDTPLLYRAVPSWFVKVTDIKDRLLDENSKTYWVPDHVREGRFQSWLENARDWAISRNRYWGTPIPLWVSEDFEEIVCVSSIADLAEKSGVNVDDLHRDTVDKITIPSKQGKGDLRRIDEVFDCWFESGSMPYAQKHYPFDNKEAFEQGYFPADFVAEGIDQTRGWFYTLMVIGVALFDKAPFKNLIANGLVLASDGKKMSKRLKNYPDPNEVLDKYGADALRLYLINSPVVRAEVLRFKEEGVLGVCKDVFLPWFNAYRFFVQNVYRLEKEEGIKFSFDPTHLHRTGNIMDKWILAYTQDLVGFVRKEMAAYRLYTVVPRLLQYVDNLTNWYVRANRPRIRGEVDTAECEAALDTMCTVLFTMVRIMAPFTPFLTEYMYQNLKKVIKGHDTPETASVHYLLIPEVNQDLINPDIVKAVSRMQKVIEVVRVLRDRATLPLKYPLPQLILVNDDEHFAADMKSLTDYIVLECNVKDIIIEKDPAVYGLQTLCSGNRVTLGKKCRKDAGKVVKVINEWTSEDIAKFQAEGKATIEGYEIDPEDVQIERKLGEGSKHFISDSTDESVVLLDTRRDENLLLEGMAREIVNRVQKLRKKADLVPTDRIDIYYHVEKDDKEGHLSKATEHQADFLRKRLGAGWHPKTADVDKLIIEEASEITDGMLRLWITEQKS